MNETHVPALTLRVHWQVREQVREQVRPKSCWHPSWFSTARYKCIKKHERKLKQIMSTSVNRTPVWQQQTWRMLIGPFLEPRPDSAHKSGQSEAEMTRHTFLFANCVYTRPGSMVSATCFKRFLQFHTVLTYDKCIKSFYFYCRPRTPRKETRWDQTGEKFDVFHNSHSSSRGLALTLQQASELACSGFWILLQWWMAFIHIIIWPAWKWDICRTRIFRWHALLISHRNI